MRTFANSEDPSETPHYAAFHRVYTVCKDRSDLQPEKYNILKGIV